MDSPVKSNKTSGLSNKVVIGAAAVVVAAVVGTGVFIASRPPAESSEPVIGYAAEAKVMLDQDSLQAAFDKAVENAAKGNVALQYQNDAYSEDGSTFICRIVNSKNNIYDMYLAIYADVELKDQLFLSGLVPPGSGFEEITLDRALEPGDHTVYVALSQVETGEDGKQLQGNQVIHTMVFHVE